VVIEEQIFFVKSKPKRFQDLTSEFEKLSLGEPSEQVNALMVSFSKEESVLACNTGAHFELV